MTGEPHADADAETLQQLQERIGHRFGRPQLLQQALTHRSWANERGGGEDNEVLEFLGDSVLGLLVSDLLVKEMGDLTEGQMSKLKSYLVSADTLGRVAAEFGLGPHIRLGRGEEKTDGRAKSSILANAFEAVLAALYVDGGLEIARAFVLQRLAPLLEDVDFRETTRNMADFKSALQEHVQALGLPLPVYEIVEEEGPDHAKVFHVEVSVVERGSARGDGSTKKRAEQLAARRMLEALAGSEPGQAEIQPPPSSKSPS